MDKGYPGSEEKTACLPISRKSMPYLGEEQSAGLYYHQAPEGYVSLQRSSRQYQSALPRRLRIKRSLNLPGVSGGFTQIPQAFLTSAVLLQPRFQRSCRNPILPTNPNRSQLTGLDHFPHLLFAGLEIGCDLLDRKQRHQAHGSSTPFLSLGRYAVTCAFAYAPIILLHISILTQLSHVNPNQSVSKLIPLKTNSYSLG